MGWFTGGQSFVDLSMSFLRLGFVNVDVSVPVKKIKTLNDIVLCHMLGKKIHNLSFSV